MAEELLAVLQAALQPDEDTRLRGEAMLKAYAAERPEFGPFLLAIMGDQGTDVDLRKMAGTQLAHYVEAQWYTTAEERVPQIPDEVKAHIRDGIIGCLADSRISPLAAKSVTCIAAMDFPEAWPEVFPKLKHAMLNGNPETVYGAMLGLMQLSDVDNDQTAVLLRELGPALYRLMASPEVDLRSRTRAINLLTTLSFDLIKTAKDDKRKRENQAAIGTLLPEWMTLYLQMLATDFGPQMDTCLLSKAIESIIALLDACKPQLQQFLPDLLSAVFKRMVGLAQLYHANYIVATEDTGETVDEEGVVYTLESTILSVFELIKSCLKKCHKIIAPGLPQLVDILFVFNQITMAQATEWLEDGDQFIDEEDDEVHTANTRLYAQDVLDAIVDRFPESATVAVHEAAVKKLQEAVGLHGQGDASWWRIAESALIAIGMFEEKVYVGMHLSKFNLDIAGLLSTLVYELATKADQPFVQGRTLWLAGKFARLAPVDVNMRFLDVANQALPVGAVPLQYGAAKAIADIIKALGGDHRDELAEVIPALIDSLIRTGTKACDELQRVILEALMRVIAVHQGATAQRGGQCLAFSHACLLKGFSDVMVTTTIEDIYTVLAQNPLLMPELADKCPRLFASVLRNESPTEGLTECVVRLVQKLVSHMQDPLTAAIFEHVIPPLLQLLQRTFDKEIMQAGSDTLRILLRRHLELCLAVTISNTPFVNHILSVIERMLTSEEDLNAMTLGKLVSALIQQLGTRLGEILPQLLEMVLLRLQRVKTLTPRLDLLQVMIKLVHLDLAATVDFLASRAGALEFLLQTWARHHLDFLGQYRIKLSVLGLAKMAASQHPRVNSVMVDGQPKEQGGIATRSKQKVVEYTQVPFQLRVAQLLAGDCRELLSQHGQAAADGQDEWEDLDDYEDDDDDGEDLGDDLISILARDFGAGGPADGFVTSFTEMTEDAEEEEEDRLDPLYSVDLKVELTNYFRFLATNGGEILAQLSPVQQETVQQVLS